MVGADKDAGRALIMNRSSWSASDVADIKQYCAADVDATAMLLSRMEAAGEIDWTYALLRGRYTAAVAAMERIGIPIDTEMLARLVEHWSKIKLELIARIDHDYGVYDGTTFKLERFAAYLARDRIQWPRTETGQLSLADDVFRDMAKAYPQLYHLKELRASLAEMRLSSLTVGADGFNRCLLSPFGARSGRNTPSNSKFVYGPAVWMRGLIRPPEGYGLAYIDWRAQEVALAAALFGDERMKAAYLTGDVYLGFAKDAGLAPLDATAATHGEIRELCKGLVFLLNYGGGDELLAQRLGVSRNRAAELKALHQATYATFWRGSDVTTASAYANRFICSAFGWPLHVNPADRPQSIINYPMQSNGSDMMRISAIAATEEGIQVAAPVHDAFLILAPVDRLEHDIARMRAIMESAGTAVTGGMPVFADLKPEMKVLPGGRYRDKRGTKMWDTVLSLLPEPQAKAGATQRPSRA
jgi:DNA polymerase I-like protein with 3'-5' exonuclease and polymerase domains